MLKPTHLMNVLYKKSAHTRIAHLIEHICHEHLEPNNGIC